MRNAKKYMRDNGIVFEVLRGIGAISFNVGKDRSVRFIHTSKRQIGRAIKKYAREVKEFQELKKWMDEVYLPSIEAKKKKLV